READGDRGRAHQAAARDQAQGEEAMILAMMSYAFCVAALLGLFAWVTERVCTELGWAKRWIWVFALGASLAMPAYAWLAPAVGHEPRLFALPFQIDFVPDEIPLNEEGS